jgi:hypothetical protein
MLSTRLDTLEEFDCMHKENTVTYHGVGSYCPTSSHDFAEEVAEQITTAVGEYKGGCLEVRGYTPPYDEGGFPAGFLLLILRQEGLPYVCIGIGFGQHDVEGQLARQGLDASGWSEDRTDPHGSSIYAINFDEAWRIVCLAGSRLELQQISLSYGC